MFDIDLSKKVIGEEQIKNAHEVYRKYKEGKANLDKRVIQNEDWWKLNHWRNFNSKSGNEKDIQPVSAWLFNSINNKHADFMDNYPMPNILAREKSDEETSKTLSSIVPVILENCNFEQVYSDNATEKLKNGPAIYAVYFNPRKNNGLGDIDIRAIDILNFFWEPGIQDIQDSRNIFLTSLIDNDVLLQIYPSLQGKLDGLTIDKSTYNYDDNIDTSNKSVVFDWYYKKNVGNREILHYVKYVGNEVLYSSEDDEGYKENGYYHHGLYPFVVDVLFVEKGTPTGFGYIDIMKSPQEYIDKLNQAILENAQWSCKPRFFLKDNSSINEEEFTDTSKQVVHLAGNIDEANIRQVEAAQLNGNYLSVLQYKVDELKETSGNRDFSQGSTTAGVTAASAIAALQEAGSKTSRDMIKGSYRAFTKICNIIIELIRQFYDEARIFRITGEGSQTEYIEFDNSNMQIDLDGKKPIFDIRVKAQKSSPYAREAQNELAIQFYNLGFFNPELSDQALSCIEMMDFEGKENVRDMIEKNGTMYQQILNMQQSMLKMGELIGKLTGDNRVLDTLLSQYSGGVPKVNRGGIDINTNEGLVEKAKRETREASEVR